MAEKSLSPEEVKQILQSGLPQSEFKNRKVLLIVPDHTRTAPVGQMFKEGCDGRLEENAEEGARGCVGACRVPDVAVEMACAD